MSISLLYRNGAANTSAGTVGKHTLDQLAVYRLVEGLHLSRSDAACFLRTLSAPLTEDADIVYRREVLDFFEAHPALLSSLETSFDRFSTLKTDYNDLKKEKRRFVRAASKEGSPDAAKNVLQAAGLTLKRCLLLLQSIELTLAQYQLSAQGLSLLREELQKVTAEDALAPLVRLCTRLEQYSEFGGAAIRLGLDHLGAIAACDLADRQRIPFQRPKAKKKKFQLIKKPAAENPPAAPISLAYCVLQSDLRTDAMLTLSDQVDALAGALFSRFADIGRELCFYRSALKYVTMLREKGAPLCYADVSGDGSLTFQNLYDPLLLQTVEQIAEVVPNDFAPSLASGIALFGANGSGKTVWLRSVGLLHLLSQAGLPVPATSAVIPLYRQIFTHFASAEREFEAGNEAGRFEQEVRELASIFNEIENHGLLLFNETFQTTAYREASEGLSHILRYLAEEGNRWILTTHLTELPIFFKDGEVSLYKTADNHRVLQMID